MNFKNLDCKVNEEFTLIDFKGTKIKVSKYLPVVRKENIINQVLNYAKDSGSYNPFEINIYFHVAVAAAYTDIDFMDDTETIDNQPQPYDVYDAMESSGLLTMIINAIGDDYTSLVDSLNEVIEERTTENNSVFNRLDEVVKTVTDCLVNASQMVNNFDESKYQAVIDFAKAANGGRDINTNE